MPNINSIIAIPSSSLLQIQKLLEDSFGVTFTMLHQSMRSLGIIFSVMPAPDEWRIGIPEFNAMNLPDDKFYREFDVSQFTAWVDVSCSDAHSLEFLVITSLEIAKILSRGLNTDPLVFFDGTHIPFCHIKEGVVVEVFASHASEFLQRLSWIPKEIKSDVRR